MWSRVKKWGEKSLIIITIAMVTLAVGAIFYRAIYTIVIFYGIGKEDLIRGEALNFISILVAISVAVGGWLVTYKYRQDEKVARYTDWIIAAFVFFAFLWTGLQLDWIGDTTKVTDVLSFAAIIVAAGTAIYGWRRADRVARDAREQTKHHAEKERERIAKAEAVILYRKLSGASITSFALLLRTTTSPFENLLGRFPFPISESEAELLDFYVWLQKTVEDIHQRLPAADQFYDELSSLYKYQTRFGDLFMDVVESIEELNTMLKLCMKRNPAEQVESFARNQKLRRGDFLLLMSTAAGVSLSLEYCRRALSGIEFQSHFSTADIVRYNKCFYEALRIDSPFDGKEMNADEYMEMLEATNMIFATAHRELRLSMFEN